METACSDVLYKQVNTLHWVGEGKADTHTHNEVQLNISSKTSWTSVLSYSITIIIMVTIDGALTSFVDCCKLL